MNKTQPQGRQNQREVDARMWVAQGETEILLEVNYTVNSESLIERRHPISEGNSRVPFAGLHAAIIFLLFLFAAVSPSDAQTSNFVSYTTLGNLANNFTGFGGMAVKIGGTPITVTQLGRMFVPGNTGSHTLKIVNASTGADVPGGSVSVSMTGGTAGNFVYGTLPSGITLNVNTSYYIMSQETSGGDQFYDNTTTARTTGVANLIGPVYGTGAPYTVSFLAGQLDIPVDFQYTTSSLNVTGFLTSSNLGQLNNSYTGFGGMIVQIGGTSVTVKQLGRMFAPGNTGSHTLKIVDASTGVDVPGGSVSVSMAGGTVGNFVYGILASGVMLNANTSYYIMSQETSGGDFFYDGTTTARTTSVGSLVGLANGTGAPYTTTMLAGQLYIPLDFQYSSPPTAPTVLTATTASSSQINLEWSPSLTGGVSYVVLRNGAPIITNWTSTTYADTGLAASTAYSYQVRAVSPAGNSPLSNSASGTTLSPNAPIVLLVSPIGVPASAMITINGANFSSPSVSIGGKSATIQSSMANTIVVQVPPTLLPGIVNVQVSTAAGASNTVPLMVILPGCPLN